MEEKKQAGYCNKMLYCRMRRKKESDADTLSNARKRKKHDRATLHRTMLAHKTSNTQKKQEEEKKRTESSKKQETNARIEAK
jgi:hypothetical protein